MRTVKGILLGAVPTQPWHAVQFSLNGCPKGKAMKHSLSLVPRLSLPGHQSVDSIQATIRKSFPWPLLPMQPMAATWKELEAYPVDIFVIFHANGKPTRLFTSPTFDHTAGLEYRSSVAMHDPQYQTSGYKEGWQS